LQYPERVVGVLGHSLLGLGVFQPASGDAARVVGRDGVFGGPLVGDAVEGGRAARSSRDQQQERVGDADALVLSAFRFSSALWKSISAA
jgi:hypothetical protein